MRLTVSSSIEGIASATQQAVDWLERHQADGAIVHWVSLVIEELMTNCIKYGYADEGEHAVEVELERSGDEFRIVLVDDGIAFNPLLQAAPDLSTPVEEREIGGLGLFLLREMSDGMSYERVDGKNRVTVRKRIKASG